MWFNNLIYNKRDAESTIYTEDFKGPRKTQYEYQEVPLSSMMFLIFKIKENPLKYVGDIDKSKISNPDDNFTVRSLSYSCETCNSDTTFKVFERSRHWSLFSIPLGNSDYRYRVFCWKCKNFIFQFTSKEMKYLRKTGIMVDFDMALLDKNSV